MQSFTFISEPPFVRSEIRKEREKSNGGNVGKHFGAGLMFCSCIN